MARQAGVSSRWGAFLDSTLDRVADAAIFGGFALWYAGGGDDLVLCAVAHLLPRQRPGGRRTPRPAARSSDCRSRQRPGRAGRAAGDLAGGRRVSPGCTTSACPASRCCCRSRCGSWPSAAWSRWCSGWSRSAGSPPRLMRRPPERAEDAEGERRRGERRSGSTDALYGLGWSAVKQLPEPVAARARPRPSPTWPGSAAARASLRLEANWPAWCPTPTPARLRRALPGRDALLPALLDGVLPAAGLDSRSASATASTSRTCTISTDGARRRPRRRPRAAAHGQLGPGGRLGRPPRLRTPFTTVAERLKPETLYDRFVAYREGLGMEVLPHTGGVRLRHAGPAAAGRRPGLPGRRPRPVRLRCRGEVLRRGHPDARRPGPAGPADRGAAAAGHALVRRLAA